MTRAFVTGVSGQDGGYLAERLLAEGVGGARPRPRRRAGCPTSPAWSCTPATSTDVERGPARWCSTSRPDEVYNLAAV